MYFKREIKPTATCSDCGEEKDTNCFVADKRKHSGVNHRCKTCAALRKKFKRDWVEAMREGKPPVAPPVAPTT
jgi:hypothetical protein